VNYVKDKVIVITGAGSGFGRLTTIYANELGGKVVCADINEDAVKETVSMAKAKAQEGGDAAYKLCNVTKRDDMFALSKFAVDTFGRIDVWINNAGTMPLSFFTDHEIAWKAWETCIDVNIKGTINGISACIDQMRKQGCGHVINLSSIYGNAPVAGGAVYEATKVAVKYLTEVLRIENQGVIKTTVIRPTGVNNTNLAAGVVNMDSIWGILGGKAEANKFLEIGGKLAEGTHDPAWVDQNSIQYWNLDAESLAKNIIYCINQPWGVEVSDITVRASGEQYVL